MHRVHTVSLNLWFRHPLDNDGLHIPVLARVSLCRVCKFSPTVYPLEFGDAYITRNNPKRLVHEWEEFVALSAYRTVYPLWNMKSLRWSWLVLWMTHEDMYTFDHWCCRFNDGKFFRVRPVFEEFASLQIAWWTLSIEENPRVTGVYSTTVFRRRLARTRVFQFCHMSTQHPRTEPQDSLLCWSYCMIDRSSCCSRQQHSFQGISRRSVRLFKKPQLGLWIIICCVRLFLDATRTSNPSIPT